MEPTPSGLVNDKKHTLGHRAFYLFLSRRINGAILLFIIAGAAWYAERWFPPDSTYWVWGVYVAQILILVSVAYFLFILFRTWMEYRFYTYTFTNEAFIITFGAVTKNEVGALYHQIQNVNIERSMMDRMAGVSKVVIFMVGADRDSSRSKIILPAVGRTKAKLVQKELLVRAQRHTPGA